ncbi:hypothetical protein OG21DRAFT_410718 [Imleria badia]|nr:hypothetical protein OG21DRAFT_410718 [Imleria badia]
MLAYIWPCSQRCHRRNRKKAQLRGGHRILLRTPRLVALRSFSFCRHELAWLLDSYFALYHPSIHFRKRGLFQVLCFGSPPPHLIAEFTQRRSNAWSNDQPPVTRSNCPRYHLLTATPTYHSKISFS